MIGATLAEGWSLERAGYLLRAFLRAGAHELASRPDVPVSVVINEYVELAHDFLSRDEARFINAVLDRLAGTAAAGWRRPGRAVRLSAPTCPRASSSSLRRLRPLATARGALDLTDDAALLDPAPGHQLVLTKDAMVAGVHFLPDDPLGQIAQKLLRVNLSDLAAMGAAPLGYLLALARGKETSDDWLAEFCAGLADNAPSGSRFWAATRSRRLGRSPSRSPRSVRRPRLGALRRGAAPDDVWVSGTLGDGALGLKVLQGELEGQRRARLRQSSGIACPGRASRWPGAARHRERGDRCLGRSGRGPRPASSRSPGWAPNCAPTRCRSRTPPAASGARDAAPGRRRLRAAVHRAAAASGRYRSACARTDLPLTRIGAIRAEPGLHVLDEKGQELPVRQAGWQHF